MEKKITVILTVYNSRFCIERALASLISNRKFLKEVLIIDDCGEETYDDILGMFNCFYPIRYIRNEVNRGAGVSRRIGIVNCNSEWLTFLDADDCLTPNSLRYVNDHLTEEAIWLHTKSIYYESGRFNPESIRYSKLSCGGNFYRREFLVKHNLYPDMNLRTVEDEYFNNKITFFIEKNFLEDKVKEFDYPVYEVHHDYNDTGTGLALSNMVRYFITDRIYAMKLLVEEFLEPGSYNKFKTYYVIQMLFIYANALIIKKDNTDFTDENFVKLYKEYFNIYKMLFNDNLQGFLKVLEKHPAHVQAALKNSKNSVGGLIATEQMFKDFIVSLEN